MDPEASITVVLKNYRPFQDTRPATIELRPGLTSFIGINNAGKSALLKFFYEFRGLFAALTPGSGWTSNALTGNAQPFDLPSEVPDATDMFNNQTGRPMEVTIRLNGRFDESSPRIAGSINASGVVVELPRDQNQARMRLLLADSPDGLRSTSGFVSDGFHLGTERGAVSIVDLIAAFAILRDTLYIGPFRNAINVGTREQYYDIQVGQSFIQRWKRLLTGTRKAEHQAALGLMDDIRRVFGFSTFSINASEDEQTLLFFVNERSYRLSELGAGLAQFVVATVNAAVRRPSFVLIDEPELNLHPRLQLEFLTLLATHAKSGVLFATHSMGLARAGSERIYSVRRVADGDSEVKPLEGTPQLLELLGELGFEAYKDLGYSGVLLVEGPTELKSMQQLTRLYGLDHKYVLVPLGGGELINVGTQQQLAELGRLTENVIAIIDSERLNAGDTVAKPRAAFVTACEKAGIRVHVLERRAIENYFSERALTAAFGKRTAALGPFEKLNDGKQDWPKADNWKAARQMTRKELDATDFGRFLALVAVAKSRQRTLPSTRAKGPRSAATGTARRSLRRPRRGSS